LIIIFSWQVFKYIQNEAQSSRGAQRRPYIKKGYLDTDCADEHGLKAGWVSCAEETTNNRQQAKYYDTDLGPLAGFTEDTEKVKSSLGSAAAATHP
jgi:hypothetical protein